MPRRNPAATSRKSFSGDAGFSLLVEGTHVLAIQAFNYDIADQGFSLIADLLLDNYFTILNNSSVDLSGKAALPGTDRVTVDGQEASFEAAENLVQDPSPQRRIEPFGFPSLECLGCYPRLNHQ